MTVVCPVCHIMVDAYRVSVTTYQIARHQPCPYTGNVTVTGVR